MDIMDYVYLFFSFVFGAVIGSFLNVLIYRMPNHMSIVKPGSHCFSCGAPIKWYDNIPILSYCILRGKCRNCKSAYSFQYCFIEICTAILYVFTYMKFRQSWLTVVLQIVISCFIVIFYIDLKHYIIPDSMLIVILLMAILSIWIPENHFVIFWYDRLIGLAVVGIIFLILFLAEKICKKELMGFGDIKLFGVMGILLGYQLLLFGILISAIIALLTEVILLKSKHKMIPFGPYLTIGFTIVIFFGVEILNWYSKLFV